MTNIATKLGAVIVKDGAAAERCECCGSTCDACVGGTIPQTLPVVFTLTVGGTALTLNLTFTLISTGGLDFFDGGVTVCHIYRGSWGGVLLGSDPSTPYWNDVPHVITIGSETFPVNGIIELVFVRSLNPTPNRFMVHFWGEGPVYPQTSLWWRPSNDVDLSPGSLVFRSASGVPDYQWSTYYGVPYVSESAICYRDFGTLTLPGRVRFPPYYASISLSVTS